MSAKRILLLTGILDALVAVGSIVLNVVLDHRAPLAVGLVLIALITFFGFMLAQLERHREAEIGAGPLRFSVAVTVIVVYLCLLAFSVFNTYTPPEHSLGQAVFSDFTTFASVVVGFYFSASAVAQVGSARFARSTERDARSVPGPDEEGEPPPPRHSGGTDGEF